jgi:hypothetical protein
MRKMSAFLLLPLFILSCVSEPKQASAPAWVLNPPPPDGDYTYFVGYSSAGGGDIAKATDDATANLVASIMNYIGTRITVDSTATAKASLESYQADIVQSVRSESAGRLTGFMVKERFQAPGPNSSITMYILAAYQTKELEKEKARIAALFREREDAVAKPEAAGDAAVSAGRWFDAVKSYVEAAVAASGSDIDNADVKMERTINKARAVLAKLRFVRVDGPATAALGKAYPKPFQARLVYGEGDAAPGIPGAEVAMVYQTRNAAGRILTRTERGLTDARGVVSFSPPPPDFVGKASFSYRLNFDSLRDLMDRIPLKYDAYAQALADDMGRRILSFDYTITSAAKDIATGVVVIDLLDDGKQAGTVIAQGGLFETLAKEKFKAGLAPIDPAVLISGDDARILALAKRDYGSALGRIIYGSAKIESAVKDGSMWQASARMSVKCVDLATGIILYATEKTAIAVASDEAGARRAALQQVARENIAKDLMVNLP